MVTLLRAALRSEHEVSPEVGPALPTAREQALALDLMVEESTCVALCGEGAFVRKTWASHQAPGSARARVLARAIASLRAGFDAGVDRPGHLADWLRAMEVLYGDLDPGQLPKVLAVHGSFFSRRRSLHAPMFETFSQSVGAALAARERALLVGEIVPSDRSSFPGLVRYWEAAGLLSPLCAADEGCYGREDLLDHRGWRTARWLVASGWVPAGSVVLDLGCGVGRVTRHLAPLCERVVAVDVSRAMLQRAARRLGGQHNVVLLPSDGRTLPMERESADLVLALRVLESLTDHRARGEVLLEMARVLRSGCRAVVTFGELTVRAEGGPELFDVRLRKLAGLAGLRLLSLLPLEAEGEWVALLGRV